MVCRIGGFVRLVHPFPSALNALVVLLLALLAGGSPAVAALLGLGMLGLQFSIGAFNDACDVDLDALSKPAKPIPAGLVTRAEALRAAALFGGGGLVVAAALGPTVLLLAALMLAAGLAYDGWLRRGPWGWTALAFALPLLPVYAWHGATGELPPRAELLLPVAALAGPLLQVANGIVDLEADARAGVVGLAGRLGHARALVVVAALSLVIHGLAWITVASPGAALLTVGALALAGLASASGVLFSASSAPGRREWGWRAQATGIGLLAVGWLSAVAGAGA